MASCTRPATAAGIKPVGQEARQRRLHQRLLLGALDREVRGPVALAVTDARVDPGRAQHRHLHVRSHQRELVVQRLRDRDDRVLRGVVRPHERCGDEPGYRRGVDDVAGVLLDDAAARTSGCRESRPTGSRRCTHCHVSSGASHDRPPAPRRRCCTTMWIAPNRASAARASSSTCSGSVTSVGTPIASAPPSVNSSTATFELGFFDIAEDDAHALGREPPRQREPDATRAAGDHGDPACRAPA